MEVSIAIFESLVSSRVSEAAGLDDLPGPSNGGDAAPTLKSTPSHWLPHLHGPFLAGITGQAVTTK